MIKLLDIKEYVQKMAHIISIVLEMDVLVCDNDLYIIGDSEDYETGCNEFKRIGKESIMTKVMTEKITLVYANAKQENYGCSVCLNKNCTTESIIGYPLICDEKVVGAIGIYAQDQNQRSKLISQKKFFIDFIDNMSELIINKIVEEQQNVELLVSQKRLSEIIESINFALISIDENNHVIHYNQRFRNFFLSKTDDPRTLLEILQLLGNIKLSDFITKEKVHKEGTFSIKSGNEILEYDVTFSPVEIDKIFKGSTIYFRKASEMYVKANKLFNNFPTTSFDDIIGNSKEIIKVKEEAKSFSSSSSTVLIQGESGTGKEIFARAIHCQSDYKNGPFVTVNCAAIPDNLLESELFGHEEGAFTGSMKGGRVGNFELANNGTLFLDEIGELPIHLQPKLLRALQERKIQRIGSSRSISVNIRIIVATNRNLEAMILSGEFREDLYYRLSVIPIEIPPVRNRKDDIPYLLSYFLSMYNQMLRKDIRTFDSESLNLLKKYNWPGNVRELQNMVEYAVNKCDNEKISIKDLPSKILSSSNNSSSYVPQPLIEVEIEAINNAIAYFGDTLEGKELAAKHLGISRATLYRRIKK